MDFKHKALLLCKEVSACDENLSLYVDHQGDECGPTFHLWDLGVEDFNRQCKAAIKQHAIAIACWKKMQKLNKFRSIAEGQNLGEVPDVDDLGRAIERTHNSINAAIQRCHNPNNDGYEDYGARGIIVCEHWRESYRQFIVDMGLRPEGLSMDRRDNDKGYLCPRCCPPKGNCRWENRHIQRVNQRPRRKKERTLTPRGEKMVEWWSTQPPEVRQKRMTKAQFVAGDALNEWRAKKTTECLRCGHTWSKTIKTRSRMCPKCHSSKWDVPPNISTQSGQ